MARYRQKDEIDLAWNRLRRRITRELDTQIGEWREQALNVLLTEAWNRYKDAISKGEAMPELEANYHSFVAGALAEAIDVKLVEADHDAAA